jgi:hypothetical protein
MDFHGKGSVANGSSGTRKEKISKADLLSTPMASLCPKNNSKPA